MTVNTALIANTDKQSLFHPADLAKIDFSRIPKHIAIIPDGNRRWARKILSDVCKGHKKGADVLLNIVKAAQELGVKEMTFYTFSTENWGRSPEEIAELMMLFNFYLQSECESMVENGVKLNTIGDIESLPSFLKDTVAEVKFATSNCDKFNLILALNYGSRNELCRAFRSILVDYENGDLDKSEIDEKMISRYLDTKEWSDPELLIRTSGELRVSNFLLWQISYTEIHSSSVFWPEFTPHDLVDAILDYQKRERRWGTGN